MVHGDGIARARIFRRDVAVLGEDRGVGPFGAVARLQSWVLA